ncbi:ABC transporter ATP-binding protein [Corynebacterium heidelbergense]|uniref:ABC-type quaternary amine transporter n=1 Tax=Corynebacterium heidelbergense TaxID=2055947 RepID=A0A364V4M2_9CORY|nr:ATP-binding cassette domain-containing protein [Corynebacterium heidelbergense]RAV31571.1 ABC transporter ATP-binding protein [Corynebacterium heidelbergense]
MITFQDVSVHYPGTAAPAVKSFDFEVPSGSITTLLGSSGCGKTTLLKCINRLVTPTGGRVLIDGEDVADKDPVKLRRSIGYVLQNSGLLPHRTVLDNIATVLRLNGVAKSEAAERARGAAELVNLYPELLDRYPRQLSGGQQQRVSVARALAADPNILLMDEPFGAVDPIVRRSLQEQLLDLQARLGKTIVLVTHDVSEAMTLGDQVALLAEGGELAQSGTPQELAAHPANDFVRDFLGFHNRNLTVRSIDGAELVVDARGAVVGVLGGVPNKQGGE